MGRSIVSSFLEEGVRYHLVIFRKSPSIGTIEGFLAAIWIPFTILGCKKYKKQDSLYVLPIFRMFMLSLFRSTCQNFTGVGIFLKGCITFSPFHFREERYHLRQLITSHGNPANQHGIGNRRKPTEK